MARFTISRQHRVIVVAFPKPEHIDEFKKAVRGVMQMGVAAENPGGVGTLEMQATPRELCARDGLLPKSLSEMDASDVLYLRHVQAHYRTGGRAPLFRARATYYGGWRRRVLCEALKHAQSQRQPLLINKEAGTIKCILDSDPTTGKATLFRKELADEARKAGFAWHENENAIVLEKSTIGPKKKEQKK
ncbi:MAG: hypothetical protein Q8P02_03010 [Candidatus Micrarchaeota archaeon]|nr:hypothetical protein [Candidatus Micrarchaeota archaeon]